MEVRCVSINLVYNLDDTDGEKPLYQFKFITTAAVGDHESLPIINKMSLIGKRKDMYEIGEYYNFYNYGNGPYEGSVYTDPFFREQLVKESE